MAIFYDFVYYYLLYKQIMFKTIKSKSIVLHINTLSFNKKYIIYINLSYRLNSLLIIIIIMTLNFISR